ncbi:MAG: hypothetical protein HQ539_03565 [Parcubacteria group bacterium]|nr:hypothetical protein [Parcubacteria group bacterium]
MSKLLVIVIIIIIVLGYWFFQSMGTESELSEAEQACMDSGGEVTTALCCETTEDFPNSCLIGACGCSPDNSHEIKICECQEGCFDGEKCSEFPLEEVPLGTDPSNSTYIIAREQFTLVDGTAEKEIMAGAASKINVNIFEADAVGDINGDDLDDTAVLLTYNAGGSGTFYYIASALQTEEGYRGTNGILIGDRIAPQTIKIKDGEVIVNYTDRYPWESFTTDLSVEKTKYLTYELSGLKEKQGEMLPQDTASDLVIENWGDCADDQCESFIVTTLDGKDGVWYIEAVYDGLRDDSVRAQKKIARVNYVNDVWEMGEVILLEHKCQLDRGQQDFSTELCL